MKPIYIRKQGMVIDGNLWQVHPQTGEPFNDENAKQFINDYQEVENRVDLDALKQEAISNIKRQAAQRIHALDWQLQRAEERLSQSELTGEGAISDAESQLLEVLDEREAIRQQSNEAEAHLKRLQEQNAINEFTW